MSTSNTELLELLKMKKFQEIERIIISKKYDKYTFEGFYIELCHLKEYTKLEYFYDTFSTQINDKDIFLAVYTLCNDSTYLPLIKKLSKDQFFKNESADYYALRTLTTKTYDILDYFLNNFPLSFEYQCKKVINEIILQEKEEFFDILYKKYFSKKDPEIIYSSLNLNNKRNNFISLFKKNSKVALSFLSIFHLEDYLIKNINNLNINEEIKNKLLKELYMIRTTRNF